MPGQPALPFIPSAPFQPQPLGDLRRRAGRLDSCRPAGRRQSRHAGRSGRLGSVRPHRKPDQATSVSSRLTGTARLAAGLTGSSTGSTRPSTKWRSTRSATAVTLTGPDSDDSRLGQPMSLSFAPWTVAAVADTHPRVASRQATPYAVVAARHEILDDPDHPSRTMLIWPTDRRKFVQAL